MKRAINWRVLVLPFVLIAVGASCSRKDQTTTMAVSPAATQQPERKLLFKDNYCALYVIEDGGRAVYLTRCTASSASASVAVK